MTQKQTKEKLEKTVKKLKKQIVEQDRSEKLLRFLSLAIEQSSEGIAVSDLDGKLEYLNNAFAKMHGYLTEELIGKHLSIFHTLDQMPSVEAANWEIKKTGFFKGEIWHVKRDGTVFPSMMHNSLIRNEANKPIGMMGTMRDISDIKQAEEALKESEEKYRSLIEDSIDGIAIVQGTEVKFVNPALIKMFGYHDEKDLEVHNFLELISPEYRQQMEQFGYDREAGKKVPTRYQFKALRKDGTEFDAELSVGIVKYKGDIARQGVIRDISKEKQAEEALRESEKRYRTVVESQAEMICRFLPDGTLTFVNEAYCRYFDKDREELIGHKFTPLIPESDRDKVLKNISSLNPNTPVMTHEHQVFDPNGEICWHKWTNRAIFDDKSNLVEYQAVGWDITNRIRIEKSLQKAHDELELRVKERTRELETQKTNLEEINTAMKVLLKRMEEEKTEIEDGILSNYKTLVEPYVGKLKQYNLPQGQKKLIDILESNLKEIVSPFARQLSSKLLNLTPSEIQVANLVKQGKTSKEIAGILNISGKTVGFHRENIRKKLGLKNKKANLRSRLLSFD
jgi:PAS domain S-box-containing protein